MATKNRIKNQHLLWRSAFGPMAENIIQLDSISQNDLWNKIKTTSLEVPKKIGDSENLVDGIHKDLKEIRNLNKNDKKQMRRQSKEDISSMNIIWLNEMINSKAQLREKMSLFWHGHFACRVVNSFLQQELLHTIRANALGNFGQLLKDVSKSPAMLRFLNNQQNKKSSPNENFAREVMELFTIGRGNYTEADVKEAARAFTGWAFGIDGKFIFNKNQHDYGGKIFLGKKGNFDGDDILNILLEQPQTSKFIVEKIYKNFVNSTIQHEHIEWLAKRFLESDYNILSLLQDIFTSSWFYDEKNIASHIKSPIELIVGIRRFLPLEMQNDYVQINFQKLLGQILFYPPNVAGWAGGKIWIDSSTLMTRMLIPQMLSANENLNIIAKTDDDVEMGEMNDNKMNQFRNKIFVQKQTYADIDWTIVEKNYDKVSRDKLATTITDTLWQTGTYFSENIISKYVKQDSRGNFIKSIIVKLMCTPEYQIC